MQRLVLFFAQSQDLLRREAIARPAFEAHYYIQSAASIGPSDLRAIQYRRLMQKISPGQLDAEIGRNR